MLRTTLIALATFIALSLSHVRAAESSAADEILRAAGARPGICVVVGAADGKLCEALAEGGRYLVHGLLRDSQALKAARTDLQQRGRYGSVALGLLPESGLPYADDLVNLVVLLDPKAASPQEVLRVLCPGGVALVPAGSAKDAWANAGATVEESSDGALRVTKGRPAGMDEWLQWQHDAGRTKVSGDLLAGPPRRLRWIDGPRRGRNHKDGPKAALSAGGRNFVIYDTAPRLYQLPGAWVLACRDSFNGRTLWERALASDDFDAETFCAKGDRLYLVLERKGALHEIDVATGKTLREYKERPETVAVTERGFVLAGGGPLRMMDPASGAPVWNSGIENLLKRAPVVVDGGKVFTQLGKGLNATYGDDVVCVNLADGKEVWRVSNKTFNRASLMFCRDGVLVFAGGGHALQVLSQKDGKVLWSADYDHPGHHGSFSNVFLQHGLVWYHDNGSRKDNTPEAWVGLDAQTGAKKKAYELNLTQKCYPDGATERYLLLGTMDFVDWATGERTGSTAVRAVCGFGHFVANGLVYTFPTDCRCNPWLRGSLGLAPAPEKAPPAEPAEARLAAGPAAGDAPGPAAGADDWPLYRGGPERRGVTKAEVPADVQALWAQDLGGRPSAPTIAGGRVFAATPDEHRVHALDAASGKRLWSFTADARVDGPPSYWNGLAIFGSNDGSVYAVRADDGRVAWRFRAAPADRRIFAYGQLESATPVHASVLVDGGTVCFAAGRHSEMDAGVTLYALEAATGKIRWQAKLKEPAFTDILVKGNGAYYLSMLKVDPQNGKAAPATDAFFSSGQSSPFDDDTFAFRTQWVLRPQAQAQMIVFDEKRAFGVRVLPSVKGLQKYSETRPGKGDNKLFYEPFAEVKLDKKGEVMWTKDWFNKRQFMTPTGWEVTVPVRPRALVLAGEHLFVAGPEDAYPPKRSALHGYAAADGKEFLALPLDAQPVFDGMAAAGGRLFLATQDGKLRCYCKP